MAKFHGNIGYALSHETTPGVWVDDISEREYFGDVIRETKQWQKESTLNDSLTVGNRLSVTADDFARTNFSAMRYVVWSGVYWRVSSVEIAYPRIILSIGGVYNGPKA